MKTKDKSNFKDPRIDQKDWTNVLKLYDACLANAIDLVEEAEILYKHKHYARAFGLAIIAYEEIGKSQVVADLFNDMVSNKEFEEAFRRHEIKSSYNSRKFVINTKPELTFHIDYDKTNGIKYNKLRLSATYVDCLPNYVPQQPKDIITKEESENAIAIVKNEIYEMQLMSYLTERIGSKSFTK